MSIPEPTPSPPVPPCARCAELERALATALAEGDAANRALGSVIARFNDLRNRVKALADSIQ